MQIILKNVRSLCDQQRVPLRPLTLLVGENSTGKTTFLAMVAHVSQPEFPSTRPPFNIPPFDLGTYDSIATYKGGRYGRADSFSVGFSVEHKDEPRDVVVTYGSHRGQPRVTELVASSPRGRISGTVEYEAQKAHFAMKFADAGTLERHIDLKQFGTADIDVPFFYLLRMAVAEPTRKEPVLQPDLFGEMSRLFRWGGMSVLALAPVRTRPRRTYDEFSEEFDPEGDHVPVLLARLWREQDEAGRAALTEALNKFGVSSALFRRIGVRQLGRRPTDPFQILVTMAGPPVNIPDVGYGVSQALPLVVQAVLAEKHVLLLLQQPEVHLHPRAQAALGTFFAHLVATESRHMIVETHSDYLIDRIRLEVAQGNLPAAAVQILFFEKQGIETIIHPMTLDKHGNIENAPPSYRQFFLEEEETLFSRAQE